MLKINRHPQPATQRIAEPPFPVFLFLFHLKWDYHENTEQAVCIGETQRHDACSRKTDERGAL